MGSIKTISIIVAANIKGLELGLGKANKSLAKFASGAARMGSMLSFGITAPLTALGKSAFDAFSNFENGMMKVKTVTGASIGEFKMLTAEAKRLGATTQFTAQQVSELQLVLGRKGFDPTAIKNMEQSILDLALATGEDLSLAAETVATSINAFQLESSDAARVANTLASAAANSSIQLSTFSTAFGHAGASANAVGVDLEELSAMMGVLMDNGIKASKAGTGLRKVFMKLHKEGRNFTEVLDLVTQGELGLEKAQKLVGVTAANQILILAKNKTKVAELTEEYKTNTTRLNEMAIAMGDTTFAKVKKMESAIEGMKIEMGALIAEAIQPIILKVTEWASAFQNLDTGTKKLILKIAGIAAVLGPLLLAISLVTTAWGMMATSIGLVKKAVKSLTKTIAKNPLGILAIVIASVAANWLIFRNNNRAANDELDKTQEAAKNASERIAEINKNLATRNKSSDDLLREEIKGFQDLTQATLDLKKAKLELGQDEFGLDLDFMAIGDLMLGIEGLEQQLVDYDSTLTALDLAIDLGDSVIVVDDLTDSYNELGEAIPDLSSSYSSMTGINFDVGNGSSSGGEEEETTLPFTGLEKQLSKASEGVTEFFDKWGDSINMVGDIFGKMMQNQMVDLENSHKKKADAIANSNMNEEDKATAMLNLDKETAKEKAKILRKQAIAEKAAAVVSAVMNGALAISKTLGQAGFLGIPLSAIVGALAATQVATIAASPIPAFAQGGLVTGATMGLVGEGRGTTMSNPEVIAPLDKLKSMLGDSGGGGTVIPDVRITGDDLLIVFDRASRRKERR
tara:strand:+ start:756 stop:3158 length:2403 start_codon:yes stop_codon:yes gene_type:complete